VRDFQEKAMIETRPYRHAVNDADSVADRRLQLEHEQQQRAVERQRQIALQSSPLSSAEERVQLWEKLHQLALPRSPKHKLLRVIAEQTELAFEQVLDIQRRRFAPPAPPLPAPPVPAV
jgi:uncharacterized protein YoaH (UPF0181 family)